MQQNKKKSTMGPWAGAQGPGLHAPARPALHPGGRAWLLVKFRDFCMFLVKFYVFLWFFKMFGEISWFLVKYHDFSVMLDPDDESCIRRQHKQEHEVWLKINAAEGRPPTTRVAADEKSWQPTTRVASDDSTSKNTKCD